MCHENQTCELNRCFEEMVGDRKLTEIINTEHENTKYLEGFKIPENVTAV